MVRAAAKNHPSVAVVVSPARYADVLDAVAGGWVHPGRSGSGWPSRRSRTPRPTTSLSRRGWATWWLPTRTARGSQSWLGATWHRERRAPVRREPAPAGRPLRQDHGAPGLAQAEQLHGKEMSYNNYIDADAARRAAYDHADAVRGDHQAREPVRDRRRGRHRGRLPQGLRLRPGVRVRWCGRDEPTGDRGDGRRPWPRCSPRSSSPRPSTTTRWTVLTEKKNVRAPALRRDPPGRGHRDASGQRRAARSRAWTTSRPTATTPPQWTLASGIAGGRGDAGATWSSPGGPCRVREVERDPAGQGPCQRGRRHGPGEPGRLGQARGGARR